MFECVNKHKFQKWLDLLYAKGGSLVRIHKCEIKYIDAPDWKTELTKHYESWRHNDKHWTFHHLRNLYKHIKANGINFPVVARKNANGKLSIDPGGSRTMIAMLLQLEHIPVDYIVIDDPIKDLVIQGKTIKTADEFFEPYIDVKSKCEMQMVRQDITKDFEELENYEDFWFTFNWFDMRHFWPIDDVADFNKKYSNVKIEKSLLSYTLEV